MAAHSHKARGLHLLLLLPLWCQGLEGLKGHQQLELDYATRALAHVAQLPGVGSAQLERLQTELASIGARGDDEGQSSRALELVLLEIRLLGERARPDASRSTAEPLSFDEIVAASEPGLVSAFVAWVLDRPLPWERDCSCCYPFCPADRWCIKQADKRYLACAGDSMRQHLKYLLLDQ
jgi:hypothetical protein